MDKIKINAQARDIKNSKPKKLRKEGLVPAVLYGNKIKNEALMVNAIEFEKVLRKAGESTIVDLVTPDGKTHPVLIHDVQNNYLTSKPDHVDFYEVSMTKKLKAKVALEYVGESVAVKQLGGVLVKILNEVEIECLPADLPHNLPVDISVLQTFQDSILVKNVILPAKVTLVTPPDEMVAKIQPPRDVEAELTPVVEDISKVEGAAETKPEEGAATEDKDKKVQPKAEKAETEKK